MQSQPGTEINNKKYICAKNSIKAAFVAFLCLSLVFPYNFSQSAEVDNLKQELDDKQQRLKQLDEQISQTNRELSTLVKQSNTLQNHIQIFTAQINQITAQIEASETRIEISNAEISQLNKEIAVQEENILNTKTNIAGLLRELNDMDRNNTALVALMNNNNLSDFLNAVSQIENVQGRTYELLQEIQRLKLAMEENKSKLEGQVAELKSLQASLADQRRSLDSQIQAKNTLLAQSRGQETVYKQLLAKSQAEENAIEKEIQDLENKIRGELGEKVSPGSKGLFANWPLDGILTQRYGRTGFTSLGYNFHNGLDIAAPAGAPIYNVYDGRVTATGSSNYAYGNWVTVKHNLPNGRSVVTLYAHLLRISVVAGQDLKGGQVIGTEGNTGNTTRLLYGPHRGFHLHFTVFDAEGFRIVPGAHGNYTIPAGFTYDPMDFL